MTTPDGVTLAFRDRDGNQVIDGACTGCGARPTWTTWRHCGPDAAQVHRDAASTWAADHARSCDTTH
ncbi:hypothetical protein ACIBSV_46920 [Embleya sp. NPDC050154]|uniref:hypothetical protein n=1 Tax=Embleya sp. NPDC050154 TaxID=3363988 RepID=UPI0037A1F7B9